MYFNFLLLFHFTHTVQHNTRYNQHTTFLYFISIASSLYVCVCVYTPCLAMCVCRSFTTAISLCFMLSFFLFCCLRFAHVYTHTRSLTLTHTHTNSTQARNVMRRLKDSVSSATTLGELQRTATGKWQLSTTSATAAPCQPSPLPQRARERRYALFSSLNSTVSLATALPAATKDLGNKLAAPQCRD